MNPKSKMICGVLVFSFPLISQGNMLSVGDACYQQTIEICSRISDELKIVARRRPQHLSTISGNIEESRAKLSLELPDFGMPGSEGRMNLLRLFLKPRNWLSLQKLIKDADFVYVEAPSIEAYLTALIARQAKKPLIMEMRGQVVTNDEYMRRRFGIAGKLYVRFFEHALLVIRNQSIAGLYVNESLRRSNPIGGSYTQAISDVQLVDVIFADPHLYHTSAKKMLYVGHLEKVKRVDWLLLVLSKINNLLPLGWEFDVVGDGPERDNLYRLANSLGIGSHVNFHGRINWGAPLFNFYHNTDILLMGSQTEGTSRTLLEAMASGLPVMSTDVGDAQNLLDAVALAPVDDFHIYAERLLGLLSDPILLYEVASNNRQKAEQYRLSKLIDARLIFYQNALRLCQQQR